MKRREFIASLTGVVAWPSIANAQQKIDLPLIGRSGLEGLQRRLL